MTTIADGPAPTDPEPLAPLGWPDVVDVRPPDRAVLLAIAVAAVATDVAMRSGVTRLGGAVLVAVTAIGILASGRVVNRRAWPVLLVVPVLGAWLAVRDAGWLHALDILAAGGLLVVGASLARTGDPFDLTVPGLVGRAVHAVVHGVLAPGFVARALRRPAAGSHARAFALLRGLLLAAPVVLVIGLLLGSADPVFASFFRFPADLGDLLGHLFLLGLGAWTAAGLLRLASAAPYGAPTLARRPLGRVEATTVLAGLVAVFSAFAVSQVVTVLGGAGYVRRTAGLSYAEYARSGFFQLLAVATITLGVLLALRAAVRTPDRRFVVLSEAAVVLTLALVAGAVRRLGLYEQAYGLTVLRLLSVLFALWIGGVFVLLGLSLAGVRRDRAWFIPAAVALGVAGLLVVNVADPEAFIVRRNVERLAGTERLDAWYLSTLSDDAVPVLVDALPRLTEDEAAVVRRRLCAGDRRTTGGLWAANASRSSAADARRTACP